MGWLLFGAVQVDKHVQHVYALVVVEFANVEPIVASNASAQPDIFGGAGIQREPGKDRIDNMRRADQEMRDSGSSDLFDAVSEDPRFRCTGRSAGRQDVCSFATDKAGEAFALFESADHDVEGTAAP